MSFESHLALAHPEHNNGTTPVKLSEIYVVQKLLLWSWVVSHMWLHVCLIHVVCALSRICCVLALYFHVCPCNIAWNSWNVAFLVFSCQYEFKNSCVLKYELKFSSSSKLHVLLPFLFVPLMIYDFANYLWLTGCKKLKKILVVHLTVKENHWIGNWQAKAF